MNPLEWKSIICGPPIRLNLPSQVIEMGFQPPDIITTLEMRMKCGLGKCGRCNIGPYYVCKDDCFYLPAAPEYAGRVLTRQLHELPRKYSSSLLIN